MRAADVPILRRLTLMSRKASASEGVQAVFHRLRITAPSAFRRLQEAAGLVPLPAGGRPLAGGALFADLIGINGAASGTGAIGPDEIVSLTPAGGAAAAVTGISPRQLAQAVDAGDSGVVLPVRAALAALRSTQIAGQSDRLADAFLEAVSELSPVAVCPLLAGPQIKLRQVLVDASNVARYNPDPLALETPPRVRNLRLMRDYLLHRGYFPVTLIADANLRFHVDDKPAYLALVKNHIVREAPPAMTADEILIREANDKNAPLITNDRLSEWGEAARRIERVGFLIAASGISLTPF